MLALMSFWIIKKPFCSVPHLSFPAYDKHWGCISALPFIIIQYHDVRQIKAPLTKTRLYSAENIGSVHIWMKTIRERCTWFMGRPVVLQKCCARWNHLAKMAFAHKNDMKNVWINITLPWFYFAVKKLITFAM
jgi:hypothetical protein